VIAAVLCLIALVNGLAHFQPYPKAIFRYENGVKIGSYIVLLYTDLAPADMSEPAIGAWLKEHTGSSELTHTWSFADFRGFSCYLTNEQLQTLLAHPIVAYIEEDTEVSLPEDWREKMEEEKADASRRLLQNTWPDWGQDRCDQRYLPLDGKFNPGYTGLNQHVWIIDTGILTTHTEFSNNPYTSASRATLDVNYASGTNTDGNGHGTHCAGSAGGRNAGIASQVRLHSVRVLNAQGSGTNADVISGVNYVANNQQPNACDIASMSLGGGYSAALNTACLNAVKKGVVIVVAAGNSNVDCVGTSPASADGVMTVAASDKNDNPASFTNFGNCVEVFGPGVSIKSSWYTSTTAYSTLSGTSMATPLVAGSVALHCQHYGWKDSSPVDIETAFIWYSTNNTIKLTQEQIRTGTPNRLVYDKWSGV